MFTEKQKVWCAIYGEGIVEEILHASEEVYPVVVRCKGTRLAAYTSDGRYTVDGNVTLFPYPVEITKAITKPSIDWNHVSEDFQYLAMDADGECYIYTDKPLQCERQWTTNLPCSSPINFASFTPGTCDWRDSLIKRPD